MAVCKSDLIISHLTLDQSLPHSIAKQAKEKELLGNAGKGDYFYYMVKSLSRDFFVFFFFYYEITSINLSLLITQEMKWRCKKFLFSSVISYMSQDQCHDKGCSDSSTVQKLDRTSSSVKTGQI